MLAGVLTTDSLWRERENIEHIVFLGTRLPTWLSSDSLGDAQLGRYVLSHLMEADVTGSRTSLK